MLRLIRKSGELVFNKDDAIMTRYAYGYNGIVKNYGNECDYTIENGSFKILSGRIIVDGWETDIDDAGWVFNPISTYGRQYYSVFLQINVLLETCEIKATYSSAFPVINKGDDLTQIPSGTANLLLYNFMVDNGTISSVEKKFDIIQYAKDIAEENANLKNEFEDYKISLANGTKSVKKAKICEYASDDYTKGTIEERLTAMGFKSGNIVNLSDVTLMKQGKFAILKSNGFFISVDKIDEKGYFYFDLKFEDGQILKSKNDLTVGIVVSATMGGTVGTDIDFEKSSSRIKILTGVKNTQIYAFSIGFEIE